MTPAVVRDRGRHDGCEFDQGVNEGERIGVHGVLPRTKEDVPQGEGQRWELHGLVVALVEVGESTGEGAGL